MVFSLILTGFSSSYNLVSIKQTEDIIKNTLLSFFLILCAVILHAEKVAEFPELMQPVRITIDGDEMYIVDGRTKIEVYSVSEQKLLREISKRGQGAEWKVAIDRWGAEYDRFFPDIREFQVTDDKIFVQTYRTEQGKTEFVVMDLEGNSSKSVFLPLYEEGSLVDKHVYSFSNGDYFYLKYNDNNEIWELHRILL